MIVVLIDQDGERLMFPSRGASARLESLDPSWLDDIEILHITAYSFEGGSTAETVREAVRQARRRGAKVSMDVSSTGMIDHFGIPAFLGLMAEPVVITIAVASLAGVRFPRGFMLAAQIVYGLGFVFAYWLFFESTFVIGALCPWCLLVTVSTTLVFASLTHVNLRDNNLFLPTSLHKTLTKGLRLGVDNLLVVLWLGAITTLVLAKYGPALFG